MEWTLCKFDPGTQPIVLQKGLLPNPFNLFVTPKRLSFASLPNGWILSGSWANEIIKMAGHVGLPLLRWKNPWVLRFQHSGKFYMLTFKYKCCCTQRKSVIFVIIIFLLSFSLIDNSLTGSLYSNSIIIYTQYVCNDKVFQEWAVLTEKPDWVFGAELIKLVLNIM